MTGWICLDIDGTITADPFHTPIEVIEYFAMLYKEGWKFAFITGRMLSFAQMALQSIPFPYVLSVQNGADILQMPQKKLLKQTYLSSHIFSILDDLYQSIEEDYLVYSGWELGDFCFYRPHKFSKVMKQHLDFMSSLSKEPWKIVDDFSLLKERMYPLIKCIGSQKQMQQLALDLDQIPFIHATCIKDPTSKEGFYLNLITHKNASKGAVIDYLRSKNPSSLFIGAGDDLNDIELLKSSDISIAMENAPVTLKNYAKIIAKPASEQGIIFALKQIIEGKI